jgi:hypothetical protein
MTEEQVKKLILEVLQDLIGNNRYTFQKNLQIFDGRNIQLGRTTGTIIGTEGYNNAGDVGQKLGFFGATPVIQQAHVGNPNGGAVQDSQARGAIIAILSNLENYGLHRLS